MEMKSFVSPSPLTECGQRMALRVVSAVIDYVRMCRCRGMLVYCCMICNKRYESKSKGKQGCSALVRHSWPSETVAAGLDPALLKPNIRSKRTRLFSVELFHSVAFRLSVATRVSLDEGIACSVRLDRNCTLSLGGRDKTERERNQCTSSMHRL